MKKRGGQIFEGNKPKLVQSQILCARLVLQEHNGLA